MGYLLFALFIFIPILEIGVFISVGEEIGLSWTLAIIVLTAMIGTWIMKRQGLKTLFQLHGQLNQGCLKPLQKPLRGVLKRDFAFGIACTHHTCNSRLNHNKGGLQLTSS